MSAEVEAVELCPLDGCGHPHGAERCMYAVADETGNEWPCGCCPCPRCLGAGEIVRFTWLDRNEHEQQSMRQCPYCDGTGVA